MALENLILLGDHLRGFVILGEITACLSLLFIAAPSFAHEAALGDVHFSTSCKTIVQSRFDVGVALLHSFEFREAEAEFRRVEKEDPGCVIAAWGVALSTTERSGANAPQKELAKGWTELQPWLKVRAGTEREQMYVDAVRALYESYSNVPGGRRWQTYLTQMQELREKYPEDINASLFYALGLTWTSGAGEKGLEQRRQALAILLPIFEKYPNNPGVAHYIIHAADIADLATAALPAARKYAAIAPDAPHALHMPSHIFNRLGYWKESIETNDASVRVATAWMKNGRAGSFDAFHGLNNMEYAYLQLGDDQKAEDIVRQIEDLAKQETDPWLPVDARIYFDLETHNWQDAARIEPPQSSPFEENFDAYWIETIGAARCGKPKQAEETLRQFRESETAWNKEHGWGEILGIALTEAEAWTLFSEGKHDQAVAHLQGIAQLERDHPMYYADILPRPTGEMLGDMFLEIGKPSEALRAYEEAQQLAPNRLDTLLGASRAAALAGDAALSKQYALRISSAGGRLALRP